MKKFFALTPILLCFALAPLATAQISLDDDFEDGDLAGWVNTADWTNSTLSAITGANSLKHSTNATVESTIYIQPTAYNLALERTVWRFNLQNGAWDPSGGNRFWVYLFSDDADILPASAVANGYAVGVNLTGSDDILTLWKVTAGAADGAIVTSTFDWGSGDTVGIEVTRSTAGAWELLLDADGGFDSLISAGTGNDTDYLDTMFFGLAFDYTATRAGLLWMDDVLIEQSPPPANQPPVITVPDAQNVLVSNTLVFGVTATETDGDLVTLSTNGLPANASFFATNGTSAAAGTFEFTPDESQAGSDFVVEFVATDVDGAVTGAVNISVLAPISCGLLISEYIEGSSFNKVIEIFNGTDNPVDLAASNYVVDVYNNGGTTPSASVALTGMVLSASTYVVAHGSAAAAAVAAADQLFSWGFNGNDAIVLRQGGSETGMVLDSFGQVGFDPGSFWGTDPDKTQDQTLRRKSSIQISDIVIDDVFDPVTEYDSFAIDTFDGLGEHTNGCGIAPMNLPPDITVPGPQLVFETETLLFGVTSEEVDAETIDLVASNVPANATFFATNTTPGEAAGTLEFTPTGAQIGDHIIDFYASDSDGFASNSVAITVLALSSPTTCNIFDDDFEDGDLAGWTQSEADHWTNSATGPLAGAQSLKHNLISVSSNSYIYTQPAYNLALGDVSWRFKMSNQGGDPSGANDFWVYLMADGTDISPATTADGYAVGVNFVGTSDLLTLYRVDGGAPTAIITSTLDWDENTTNGVEVTRSTTGDWELKASRDGTFTHLIPEGTVNDVTHTDTAVFGVVFEYTTSRAGLLWVDDVCISQATGGGNDLDHDGIADTWEDTYCSGDCDPPTDPTGDGDTFSWVEEYLLDFDPTVNDPPFVFQSVTSGSFDVTFGATTNSRVYTVDYSEDLPAGEAGWTVLQSSVPGGAGNTTTVSDNDDATNRAYRIRVHVP